jgi:hypothetical protein
MAALGNTLEVLSLFRFKRIGLGMRCSHVGLVVALANNWAVRDSGRLGGKEVLGGTECAVRYAGRTKPRPYTEKRQNLGRAEARPTWIRVAYEDGWLFLCGDRDCLGRDVPAADGDL